MPPMGDLSSSVYGDEDLFLDIESWGQGLQGDQNTFNDASPHDGFGCDLQPRIHDQLPPLAGHHAPLPPIRPRSFHNTPQILARTADHQNTSSPLPRISNHPIPGIHTAEDSHADSDSFAFTGDSLNALQQGIGPLAQNHRDESGEDWVFSSESDSTAHPRPTFHSSPIQVNYHSQPLPITPTFNDFVDLTDDISPRPRRMSSSENSRGAKRRRIETPGERASLNIRDATASTTTPRLTTDKAIAEVDLIDVDNDQGLSKLLEDQRQATIRAQQEQASRPNKLSGIQCIICMDTMANVTATSCGHLFCHTCLMEALIAGENQGFEPGKGQSKCPVCRKRVKRPSGRRSEALSMLTMEMKVNKRPNTVKEKNKEPIAAPKAPFISPPRSVSGKIYVKRR